VNNVYAYIWLGLTVLLLVIEASTVSLTSIWLAAGSLIAFFLALLDIGLWLQITVFLVVSLILLIFTRPFAVKFLKVGTTKTNIDALVGAKGLVVQDITQHSTGQVKLKGQIWTAVSKTGETILKDTEVIVKAIEGVKLIVIPADGSDTSK
jgi:membrane protein implicated in regulation of membrane protease activity